MCLNATFTCLVHFAAQTALQTPWAYSRPVLKQGSQGVNATSYATGGNGILTVAGTSFGLTGTVTIGGTPCTPTLTRSHFLITCRILPGSGQNLPVLVTAQTQVNLVPGSFTFDPPQLGSISPTSGVTNGGAAMQLSGSSFGPDGTVTIGGRPCVSTGWDHSLVTCTIPAGAGRNQPVVLQTGGQFSAPRLFSYNAPNITAIPLRNGPTGGGTPVTINGVNFFTNPAVTIGGRVCALSAAAHTTLVCTSPVGSGINLPIMVSLFSRVCCSLRVNLRLPGSFSELILVIVGFR